MLALPEFDTYNILPRFARNPDDRLVMSGFIMLKERAMRGLEWSLHTMLPYKVDIDTLMAYRLGSRAPSPPVLDEAGHEKPSMAGKRLEDMSEDQLKEVYYNALKSVGISVDPDASMNSSQDQAQDS